MLPSEKAYGLPEGRPRGGGNTQRYAKEPQRQPVWVGALLAWAALRRGDLGPRPKPRQGTQSPAPAICPRKARAKMGFLRAKPLGGGCGRRSLPRARGSNPFDMHIAVCYDRRSL